MAIDKVLIPTVCPYCNGKVIYTSDKVLYAPKSYGMCYYCTGCRASVGVHKGRPREPLGILATPPMKSWKKLCHSLFDPIWKSGRVNRGWLYGRLAQKMGIPKSECHFGHFTEERLKQAWNILKVKEWWVTDNNG